MGKAYNLEDFHYSLWAVPRGPTSSEKNRSTARHSISHYSWIVFSKFIPNFSMSLIYILFHKPTKLPNKRTVAQTLSVPGVFTTVNFVTFLKHIRKKLQLKHPWSCFRLFQTLSLLLSTVLFVLYLCIWTVIYTIWSSSQFWSSGSYAGLSVLGTSSRHLLHVCLHPVE